MAAMVIPLVGACIVESPIPVETRVESAILWIFCLAPAWLYFGDNVSFRRPFPFLPLVGVLYGLYYALAPALGAYNRHSTISLSPQWDYDDAVFVSVAGWVFLWIGYASGRLLVSPASTTSGVEIADVRMRRFGVALTVGGMLLEAAVQILRVPIIVSGLFSFLSTLGWFGSALLVSLAVQRRLSFPYRILTYAGIVGFAILAINSGLLSNLAFYGAVVAMAAWSGYRRFKLVWTIMAIAGALFIVSMRGVTDQFRRIDWNGAQDSGLLVGSTSFVKLLQRSIETDGLAGAVIKGFESTRERSANLDVLADVIRRTPREIPYWGGTTYLSLVGAVVPRFLWPDKPTKELGQGFGHRYGYLDPQDDWTSINLPVLVEFYANYGLTGVIIGMWLVGLIYFVVNRSVNNPGQDTLQSLTGIVLIIPLLNIESDFSLTFGGLIMNGAALWAVLAFIRRDPSIRSASAAARGSTPPLAAAQRSGS